MNLSGSRAAAVSRQRAECGGHLFQRKRNKATVSVFRFLSFFFSFFFFTTLARRQLLRSRGNGLSRPNCRPGKAGTMRRKRRKPPPPATRESTAVNVKERRSSSVPGKPVVSKSVNKLTSDSHLLHRGSTWQQQPTRSVSRAVIFHQMMKSSPLTLEPTR